MDRQPEIPPFALRNGGKAMCKASCNFRYRYLLTVIIAHYRISHHSIAHYRMAYTIIRLVLRRLNELTRIKDPGYATKTVVNGEKWDKSDVEAQLWAGTREEMPMLRGRMRWMMPWTFWNPNSRALFYFGSYTE